MCFVAQSSDMRLNDYGKMITLIVISAGIIVLLALGRISEVAGFGMLGTVLGYVTGNGRNAILNQAPSPVLTGKKSSAPVVMPFTDELSPPGE